MTPHEMQLTLRRSSKEVRATHGWSRVVVEEHQERQVRPKVISFAASI